jgi:hypothetical protein
MSIRMITGLFCLVLLSACGGSGTARLQFRDATAALSQKESQSPQSLAAAASFQMKLIAAYLAEDVDPVTQNNTGMTSMFWLNTECADDVSNCNISSPDANGTSWSRTISSFFDFSNVAAVNAALNSQGRSIDTGTYRYVRLEFCKYGPPADNSDPNIKWSYSSETNVSLSRANCGVTRAIDPPIEVQDGDSVTITLSYSLDGTITAGAGSGCAGGFCFEVPEFTPAASK